MRTFTSSATSSYRSFACSSSSSASFLSFSFLKLGARSAFEIAASSASLRDSSFFRCVAYSSSSAIARWMYARKLSAYVTAKISCCAAIRQRARP